jgi:hypothetical protein
MTARASAKMIALLIPILVVAACGQQAPATPTSAGLLTPDEVARVLDDATVWKFAAPAGIPLKGASIRIVENGNARTVCTVAPGADPLTSTIIVVLQVDGPEHLIKICEQHPHGWGDGVSTAWFKTPLVTWGAIPPTAVIPLAPGTTVLLAGSNDNAAAGQPIAIDATAPCRIELVIE